MVEDGGSRFHGNDGIYHSDYMALHPTKRYSLKHASLCRKIYKISRMDFISSPVLEYPNIISLLAMKGCVAKDLSG